MVKNKIELISPKKMPKSTQKFLMKAHKKDEQRPASKLLKLGTGD